VEFDSEVRIGIAIQVRQQHCVIGDPIAGYRYDSAENKLARSARERGDDCKLLVSCLPSIALRSSVSTPRSICAHGTHSTGNPPATLFLMDQGASWAATDAWPSP
jgi:hypothetical protein